MLQKADNSHSKSQNIDENAPNVTSVWTLLCLLWNFALSRYYTK